MTKTAAVSRRATRGLSQIGAELKTRAGGGRRRLNAPARDELAELALSNPRHGLVMADRLSAWKKKAPGAPLSETTLGRAKSKLRQAAGGVKKV